MVRRPLGAIVGALIGASVATAVSAHSGAVVDQVIHSCVSNGSGVMKIIAATGACAGNEKAVDWNAIGPKGDKGIQGVPGQWA